MFLAALLIAAISVSCGKDPTPADNTLKPSDFTANSEWTIIGTIGGASWDKDIAMKTNGTWHAAFSIDIKATDEFKFRKDKSWDVNFGAGSVKAGEKVSLAQGGDNIKIAAGKYDIYLAPGNSVAYFLTAGSEFNHADDGKEITGGDLQGAYSASLTPADKKSGITYQLNVYSFADSDGDGWGDFQGIIDHLDYLDAIGATALWLSPVNASQSYHAYDIKDYYSINPVYGGKGATAAKAQQKLQELCQKAAEKNIDIYIDYVLNHSGDQNEWFKKAIAGNATYRDYYIISDDYAADVAAKKVDNFAGQTDPHMGAWHSVSSGNAGYSGSKNLKFVLDATSKTAPKLTITETDAAVQSASSDSDVNWFVYYTGSTAVRMYKASAANTYEIVLKPTNDWGVLIKSHATEWGTDDAYKWGAKAGDQPVTFGKAKTLVSGKNANNIIFTSNVTSYFASFDKSMPDLNYGPYSSCQNSAAFQDLAASADKWINLGVNGLRLDAVMWIYQCHTDANVKFLSEWYNHCNATYKARGGKGDLYMVGEAYDWSADVVAPYYKGLPSLFDFAYYGTVKDRISKGNGSDLGSTIASIQTKNKNAYAARKHTHSTGFEDAIKLSNHDENRVASELGNNDQKKRLAGAILLTSPGKPFIYQGEELGYWGVKSSGDQNVRQPIYWEKNGAVPKSWCSFDTSILAEGMSVQEQAANDRSLLQLYRHFAYARNTHPALAKGEIEAVNSGNKAVAVWKMVGGGETVLVMHNLGAAEATVTAPVTPGEVIVSSANGNITVGGTSVTLPAYSSVVFSVK